VYDTHKSPEMVLDYIRSYSLVFWDFDGVIKDSVDVKTQAYESLFLPYGEKIAESVRKHHEANGGMSRFEKMPLYLKKAGVAVTSTIVDDFCSRFSSLVMRQVINSPWVPGVLEYLKQEHASTNFILVTATPKAEIDIILDRLGIVHYFQKIFGAPVNKADAIADSMEQYSLKSQEALMIGDASADLAAAEKNSICFLLRTTAINQNLQKHFKGPQFENFYNEQVT